MGIIINKRVNLGNGIGLNISKSGISTSVRTKYGSLGATGFSIRSGIPGLFYRKYNSKKTDDLIATVFAILLLIAGIALIYLIFWMVSEFYKLVRRRLLEREMRKSVTHALKTNHYICLHESLISSVQNLGTIFLKRIYQNENEYIDMTRPLCCIGNETCSFDVYGTTNGLIDYHLDLGDPIGYNDIFCSLKFKS